MVPRLLSFLVLTLCTISVSAQVTISIDCGSTTSSRDENLIAWSGDDGYISTGEPHTVPSSNSISNIMDTMRVFTTRKKNCYHIDSATKGRVLIRASFYYGNYDNKSSPPTFDLHFDGHYWSTVETLMTDYYYYEVVYAMKRDNISVCLAQTKTGQFPFISALEVRGLESYMYDEFDDLHPLHLSSRQAFGSNSTIRYSNDPYDRIWDPSPAVKGLLDVTSTATFSSLITKSSRPPPAVLQNAITAVSPNSSIQLFPGFPSYNVSVYINWYFSEVRELALNETRAFRIFFGDKPMSPPLKPPFEDCNQQILGSYRVSSNTTMSLVPTNTSTLPPLINAMEIFYIGEPLTNGTDNGDVYGLATLQKTFSVLEDWNGDPCLPAPYSWDWIECSNDTIPRVTALFLGSFGLSGLLPDFSSMDALQKIDFHNNSLRGPILDFLGTLPDLNQLNLSNNHFNGTVPASLSQKTSLNLVVTGNPELCTSSDRCPTTNSSPSIHKNDNLSKLLSTIIPSVIIIWFLSGV